MNTRPEIRATSREKFAATHQAPIVADSDTIFSFDNTRLGESIFLDIDHIFTDADGTVVSEGATVLDPRKATLIRQLHDKGIATTIITGKPYDEVERLHSSLPDDLPISFIYEKGAYELHFGSDGRPVQEYLLSSKELEEAVMRLKQEFMLFSKQLIERYGGSDDAPRLGFGLAGSGGHRSILSIDIFSSTPPDDYLGLIGPNREALKLTDKSLWGELLADITTFVRDRQPSWNVIDLGNGNIDITPDVIEKDTAIAANKSFQESRKVLVLGDTENDRAMFRLRQRFGQKVIAGLVYHRERALALLDDVDIVSVGMANADPILTAVLATRTDA